MIKRDLITTAVVIVVSAYAAVAQPSLPSTFKAQTVAGPEGNRGSTGAVGRRVARVAPGSRVVYDRSIPRWTPKTSI
jgi:hypothetical protein